MAADWHSVTESELYEYEAMYADDMDEWPGKNSVRIVDKTILIRLPEVPY